MRTFVGITMFLLIGLLTALGFGFSWQFNNGPIGNDDEQIGLGRQTIIRFSFVVAENTPKGLAAQKFAQLVKEKTNDTIKVELFPNGTLYNEPDEVGALQKGSIQMIAPSFSNISEVVPEWMVMDLPFIFQNDEDVAKAFQGKIGNILMRQLEPKGIVGLGFWANSFQQMTSNRGTLAHPEDFRDLKFRILPSKIIESQFRQLNAKTVPIPFNQVYRSMESGQVDGGENSISNIYSKKLYQVQKYLTISNHAYLGYGVLVNKVFWDKLSAEQQKTINEAMQEATVWANQNAIEINRKQWNELQRIGQMNVHILSKEERNEWQQALKPVYEEAQSYISKELMDAVYELRRESTNKQSGLD
ncbi:DctP family TRAP transporter solute-binding subunit [Paenibacillus alginolyticus]|uniref:DctP family TRAP transporter solute-binding subunit n=1 Tax=Paenibacillus alginolyticus TaxID=59839 RepID=A0ABT4GIG4_9BACL|nr:DctP family TRAP transporter solute-binding subunit [Paenibacillus alginolyticus]MCY9695950.1 DctP family TRAP transporter solute-binding subunit [Paenibacillus alginolyticus]MEC0146804.1 DctP family TRAP transporter solute-binding subunit [Paenibacillus alginolyticus]